MARHHIIRINLRTLTIILLCTVFTTTYAIAFQSPERQFKITDLGTVSGFNHSAGFDINNSGNVVGSLYVNPWQDPHAFIWQKNTMTTFGLFPSGVRLEATAINSSGASVGWKDRIHNDPNALYRSRLGELLNLGTLPDHRLSFANDINDIGRIVGYSVPWDGWPLAFYYDNGEMINIGTLGGRFSMAFGINEDGYVVGKADTNKKEEHAFVWFNDKMYDLGTLSGDYSEATDINDSLQVVGDATDRYGFGHAFLWQNGKMQDLGTLGSFISYASGINDLGEVVGYSYTKEGEMHAILYDEQNGMRDINNLIAEDQTEWVIEQAFSINDAGQISAVGVNKDEIMHAILLTPTGFVLTGPSPAIADTTNRLRIQGGTPGAWVSLYFGRTPGTHKIINCAYIYIDMADPILMGKTRVNKNGEAVFQVYVPLEASGKLYYIQVVENDTCIVSNLMQQYFQ